jgi:hypothetical protein
VTTDARERLAEIDAEHQPIEWEASTGPHYWGPAQTRCSNADCGPGWPCDWEISRRAREAALAEVRRLRTTLHTLVSTAQPLDVNTDRGYWACYWCDGDAIFSYGSRPPFPHAPDCPLVAAVRAAGVPLDA